MEGGTAERVVALAHGGYGLSEYLPALVKRPWPDGQRYQSVEGTLVFADISGFTKLSERLARLGRAGAEELVAAISHVFTPLIAEIQAVGGDVLKFGGDALLFLVSGPDHAARAVSAAVAMRATLRDVGRLQTAGGAVNLRMSVGGHSGTFECLMIGREHEELVVVGEGGTTTVNMEATAEAGDILVSAATAALLPRSCVGRAKGDGFLIARRPRVVHAESTGTSVDGPLEPGAFDRFVPVALRGRLESVVAESEHRHVTVAFLHFGGIDDQLATNGVAATQRKLSDFAGTVVEICDQLGVTVICTDIADDGGKFMLACGAPDAVEDPEARMLRACRGILDRDYGFPVRIGVNRGPVFAGAVGAPNRFTYSVMGDAVNLAARVMGKAGHGQLWATAAVIDRCGGRFDVSPVEPFMVKGKSQPVRAFIVGRVRHQQTLLRPGGGVFIGRTAERQLLLDRAEDAKAGRGHAVEVVAESGMGKTALIAQLSESWTGTRIHVTCEQYESATPYFAVRQLLRAVLGLDEAEDPAVVGARLHEVAAERCPDLLPWLPLLALAADAHVEATATVDELAPRFRRARLAETTVQLLDAVLETPALILLEDTFWMDDASSDVVANVVRSSRDRAWFVLMSARPHKTGLRSVAINMETIDLGPLSEDDSAEVYRSATGRWPSPHVLSELVSRARGNPFFTVELAAAIARDGVDALPPSIEDVVASRLDRLDVEDRRCLRYVSVAGTHVSFELLSEALGAVLPSITDPRQWRRLDEFLSDEGNGEYVFRHELFRRVAYEALPYARRRDLHARVGNALARRDDPDGDALPLLSLHFAEAQQWDEAWAYSVAAGERAVKLYAPVEAGSFFRRALGVASRAGRGASEISEVARQLGDVHELAAQYNEAVQAYRTARRNAPEPLVSVKVMMKEGIVRERMGRYREAVRWYMRALRTLPSAADPEPDLVRSLQAQLSVALGAARLRQGRLEDCIAACLAALPDAEAAQDDGALAHAYFLLDAAYTDLGRPESRHYRELALPIYRRLGDLVGEADVLNNLGIDAYYEGEMEQSLRYYEECRVARTRAGDVVGAAVATNNIGEVYSDQGRLDEAERLFRQALHVFEGVDYTMGVAIGLGNLGLVEIRAGRYAAAAVLLQDARARLKAQGAAAFVEEMDSRLAQIPQDVDLDTALDVRDLAALSPAG